MAALPDPPSGTSSRKWDGVWVWGFGFGFVGGETALAFTRDRHFGCYVRMNGKDLKGDV